MSQPAPLDPARQHARALVSAGDVSGALATLETAVELGKVNLSEDDPDVLLTAYELGALLQQVDDPAAARRVLEEAYAAGQWRLGDSDPLMLQISHDIGAVAEELGNRHEARKAFGRVAELGPGVLGADHWAVARARAYLGQGQDASVRRDAPPAGASPAVGGSSALDEPTTLLRTVPAQPAASPSPEPGDAPFVSVENSSPAPSRAVLPGQAPTPPASPEAAGEGAAGERAALSAPPPQGDQLTPGHAGATRPVPLQRNEAPGVGTTHGRYDEMDHAAFLPGWDDPHGRPAGQDGAGQDGAGQDGAGHEGAGHSWTGHGGAGHDAAGHGWTAHGGTRHGAAGHDGAGHGWTGHDGAGFDGLAVRAVGRGASGFGVGGYGGERVGSGSDPLAPEIGSRDVSYKKGLGVFAAVAAVLAAVVAVAALVFVLADRSGDSGDGPSVPTLAGPAPTDVVLRDRGAEIGISWKDPANGSVSFMVAMSHPGEQLKPIGTVGPGQTAYKTGGLNASLDYCFTVIAVYRSDKFATSPQVCTDRPGATRK